jgi:hypothetical protein
MVIRLDSIRKLILNEPCFNRWLQQNKRGMCAVAAAAEKRPLQGRCSSRKLDRGIDTCSGQHWLPDDMFLGDANLIPVPGAVPGPLPGEAAEEPKQRVVWVSQKTARRQKRKRVGGLQKGERGSGGRGPFTGSVS